MWLNAFQQSLLFFTSYRHTSSFSFDFLFASMSSSFFSRTCVVSSLAFPFGTLKRWREPSCAKSSKPGTNMAWETWKSCQEHVLKIGKVGLSAPHWIIRKGCKPAHTSQPMLKHTSYSSYRLIDLWLITRWASAGLFISWVTHHRACHIECTHPLGHIRSQKRCQVQSLIQQNHLQ